MKNIKKVIVVLILLILIFFSFLGIYSNFNGKLDNIMPAYKFADILTPYDEYVVRPSANVSETDVYVDKNGNTVRKVPIQDALSNVKLSKDQKENEKNAKEKVEPIDEEVKEYKSRRNKSNKRWT